MEQAAKMYDLLTTQANEETFGALQCAVLGVIDEAYQNLIDTLQGNGGKLENDRSPLNFFLADIERALSFGKYSQNVHGFFAQFSIKV